jgi:hypothetical protein
MTLRQLLFLTTALALCSGAVLGWFASGDVIPSVVRNPLSVFVEPGVTLWWLVLGGPFRTAPSSLGGMAFAVAANAAFWLFCLWALAALYAAIRRRE